uniref:Carbohydrate kinase FGGY C-terminal domain-containing protein n=1 Tax=Aegilops tauschii subsp. strangulata TaxID=200361 RepID=A0A453NIY1_AEGTS
MVLVILWSIVMLTGTRSTPFLRVADLQRTPCISKNMQISWASLLFLQPAPSFSSSRCSLKFNLFFTGCPIILPRENENVLLGAAILGVVAAEKFDGVRDAMKALNAAGKVVRPSSDPRVKKYHDAKYQIFRSLYEQQLSHRSTMAQALH